MPKRTTSLKLVTGNHRKFRLRARREIKAYINAMIANGKTNRQGTRKILGNIRRDRKYWMLKDKCMVVYFMAKEGVKLHTTPDHVFTNYEVCDNATVMLSEPSNGAIT